MSTEAGDTHTCTDKDGTSVQITEYIAFIICIHITFKSSKTHKQEHSGVR